MLQVLLLIFIALICMVSPESKNKLFALFEKKKLRLWKIKQLAKKPKKEPEVELRNLELSSLLSTTNC